MPSDSDADEGPSCIICLGPALHPVRLTCECKFVGCADCLYRWLHSKPQTVLRSNFSAGTCPTCRKVGVEPILVDFASGASEPVSLTEVAARGESALVQTMISLGADWLRTDRYGLRPLGAAAGAGKLSTVKMLCEFFVSDVDFGEKDEATPFLVACENGHIEVAEFLLSKGADCMKADDCWTPFSAAAARGHVDILKMIAAQPGFKFSQCVDDSGATPLHEAAQNGRLNVLEFLTNPANHFLDVKMNGIAGAEGGLNENNETPLYLACYNGHENCVEYMLSTFPKTCGATTTNKDGETTVIAAAHGGLYAIAKRLVTDFGVSASAQSDDGEESAATHALNNISKSTDAQVLEMVDFFSFLASNGLDLTATNGEGENLLHLGGARRLPLCKYLVESVGLSPHEPSNDGATPMFVAFNRASLCEETHALEVIIYLMEQCNLSEHPTAFDTVFSDDLSGVTFLHLAVGTGSGALVQLVVDNLRSINSLSGLINKGDENGDAPLHMAVGRESFSIVQLLLREGADPNRTNGDGQTCLHLIASRCDVTAVDMMRTFVDLRAVYGVAGDMFAPDKDGRTVLHEAIAATNRRRKAHIAHLNKLFFDAPRNILPPSPEEIMEMAEDYSLEMVKYLLAHPECTIDVLRLQDKSSGWNVLHEAASNDEPATMRFLLKHLKAVVALNTPHASSLVDFNVPDGKKNLPLHVAAENDNFFVAKLLLDAFPDDRLKLNLKKKLPVDLVDSDSQQLLTLLSVN